jgi:hypothetical protein
MCVLCCQHYRHHQCFDLLQEVEDGVRFLRPQTDYPPRELLVDKERLLARHGMTSDQRVNVLHGLALDHTATIASAAVFSLFDTRMNDRERF